MNELDALKTAVNHAGGQTALARLIGKQQATVWAWLNVTGRVGPGDVIKVERAVDGVVTRNQLRPDIYPVE